MPQKLFESIVWPGLDSSGIIYSVIVLDHHQSEIKLPNATAIVNPNKIDDKSNLNYLCAAGVTMMFLTALNKNLRNKNWFKKKKNKNPIY